MTRLAVYGAGAFGTALALTYAAAGLDVTLWARQGAEAIEASRKVPRLPDVHLPEDLRVTADPRIEADIALIAVPTQSVGAMMETAFGPGRRSSYPARKAWTCRRGSGPRLRSGGTRHTRGSRS
jgi:glycerol-3-phosphate dehydrogenase